MNLHHYTGFCDYIFSKLTMNRKQSYITGRQSPDEKLDQAGKTSQTK